LISTAGFLVPLAALSNPRHAGRGDAGSAVIPVHAQRVRQAMMLLPVDAQYQLMFPTAAFLFALMNIGKGQAPFWTDE
jgi:hypothetical protein